MSGRPLIMASAPYDVTRALFDGTVGVPGCEVEMRTGPTLPDLFERMMRGREFDVAELGWTFSLRGFGPDTPNLALPIFPNRVFRHSCVFVNADSGITEPADLVGPDHRGVRVLRPGLRGLGQGDPVRRVRLPPGGEPLGDRRSRPAGMDIVDAPPDRSLAQLLEDGEIHALGVRSPTRLTGWTARPGSR